MIHTTIESPVTFWQFPDDAEAGKAFFLNALATPTELWLRAYALTMPEASQALIEAHKSGFKRHVTVDHSQMEDRTQKALVEGIVAAGVEVTITTSYAGADYIAHEKTVVDALGNVFTGSTNWSDSAWSQINKSVSFQSLDFLAQFRASFDESVAYAWKNERSFQLMSAEP
jgi:hypothetical protein